MGQGPGRQESWIVIVEEPYLPVDAGGRVETFTFLTAATRAGIKVKVLVPTRDDLDVEHYEKAVPGTSVIALKRNDSPLAHLTTRPFMYASRPTGPLRRALATTPRQADAVISYSCRCEHLGEEVAREWQIPHLVRAHNIDSEFFRVLARSSKGPKAAAYELEYHKLRRAERAMHRSPLVTCIADISVEDHAWRRERTNLPTFHLPPFLPAQSLAAGDVVDVGDRIPDRAVFVGSLDTPTNVEALRWLLTETWPKVRARRPAATLSIVGRRPDAEFTSWLRGHPGVEVHTDVPSVASYLASASVSVNPTRSGSGVNIKAVEAMAAGVPVVSTHTGSRGLAWQPGRDLLVADDADDFAAAVARLLADPELGERIGAAGREYVVRELDGANLIDRIRRHLSPTA